MPPLSDEVRQHHGAQDAALSDIDHAVTLLHLVFEQLDNEHTGAIKAVVIFLARQLEHLHTAAEVRMGALWAATIATETGAGNS